MKVAVVGGGASGLMAAVAASRMGADVTLFEKNEKIGKKIYITGKGRCNLCNRCTEREYLDNLVRNSLFMSGAITRFSPDDCYDFFEGAGLKLKVERGNRVFPASDHASDVTKALASQLQGTEVHLNETVKSIEKGSTSFDIATDKSTYFFDKVIVATGGLSYPETGSTGDGYAFAKSFGHAVTDARPALVGMDVQGPWCEKLAGLTLKNVSLTAYEKGKAVKRAFGEMLFTHTGVSGPIVLTLSSFINRLNPRDVSVVLDLKPALTEKALDDRLLRDFSENENKDIGNCLRALLPVSLISDVLRRCAIPETKKVNSVTRAERRALLTTVKNFDILFKNLRGFDEAVVTSGGVSVSEIDPKTMESKKTKGLYFCGEVLDVDGLTGGFNLQTAFSTGFVAGTFAGGDT